MYVVSARAVPLVKSHISWRSSWARDNVVDCAFNPTALTHLVRISDEYKKLTPASSSAAEELTHASAGIDAYWLECKEVSCDLAGIILNEFAAKKE